MPTVTSYDIDLCFKEDSDTINSVLYRGIKELNIEEYGDFKLVNIAFDILLRSAHQYLDNHVIKDDNIYSYILKFAVYMALELKDNRDKLENIKSLQLYKEKLYLIIKDAMDKYKDDPDLAPFWNRHKLKKDSSLPLDFPTLDVSFDLGHASMELIADILSDISILYRARGGSGISFDFVNIHQMQESLV